MWSLKDVQCISITYHSNMVISWVLKFVIIDCIYVGACMLTYIEFSVRLIRIDGSVAIFS